MTPSPNPQPDRKLSADELIAVFVALLSIGAIFFWSITQKNGGMDLPFIQSLASPTPAPTATPSQAPAATPTDAARITSTEPTASPAPSPIAASPAPTPAAAAPNVLPLLAAASIVASPKPEVSPAPSAVPPKQFSDVPVGFWASAAIAALSTRGIVDGFPDGTFRPNKPITRAEFAEMVRRAFDRPASREALKFNDLTPNYWATGAIDKATQTRFMSGFPNGSFQPNRQIPRLQVLLALATGLKLQPTTPPSQILSRYQDAEQIPTYAASKIAAATEAGLIINDGNAKALKPKQIATRAEAAALIYEALGKGK